MIEVFISHASEDKEEVARPLAEALKREGFAVWYDEHELEVGDSIRQKIDRGLAKCRFGIVVLSPSFFAKAWPQRELDALAAKESSYGEKVILPVWHRVTRDEVAKYSPLLADRVAVPTASGLDTVVNEILSVLHRFSLKVAEPQEADPYEGYDVLYEVHQGHFGTVLKCRSKHTGKFCVVKESVNEWVSLNTLESLSRLSVPNMATPSRVWRTGGLTYEELPYVGGLRLSEAVIEGIGGLTGSVLAHFHRQLMTTLGTLHEAGIVHRDVHPENIYMLIARADDQKQERHATERWQYGHFGLASRLRKHPRFANAGPPFRLAWVLVDCTFATMLTDPSATPFRHDPYTPEEQILGKPGASSDMYAFGATIFYAITGERLAPVQERKANPGTPSTFPSGSHPAVGFSDHLKRMVSLDPDSRPKAPTVLQHDTIAPGYTGMLKAGEDLYLVCDQFDVFSKLVNTQEAIEIQRANAASGRKKQAIVAEAWLTHLQGG